MVSPHAIAHRAAVTHLRESLALACAGAAVAMGITLLAVPGRTASAEHLELVARAAHPMAWGATYLATGLWLGLAAAWARAAAWAPSAILACLWSGWAILILAALAHGAAVPSPAILATLASLVATLTAAGYWLTRQEAAR